MHIKKLEISGFKSFVDRTVIHFDHDVIGIVGPNGCGKSNIVDAIRWCMGEQSAKHLRGRSMEDVIFNGSESRPPHGLAEVTMTFDNTDPEYAQTLPEEYRDYPEIAVTRRLFRDGTSEYLMNKTQVRLRDITELFLGTGVGTKAYSVVEQGRIGQIVSARPEDRRLFIEEAAGITKYKQRRRQAERKMDATRQNLLRINDIVGEIERTRSSLKRQVAKAERFVKYRSELEDLVLHEASHRLLELTVTARVERDQMTTSAAGAQGVRSALDQVDAILAETRGEAADIEHRTDAAAKAAFEADNEVARLVAEIERSRDKLRHHADRLAAAKREQESIVERTSQLTAERAALQSRIEELSKDEEARAADAKSEDDALEVLRHEEERANQEVQELRARSSEVSTRAAAAEARLDGLLQRISDARARVEKHGVERDTHQGELETLTARKHALERSVAEAAEGKRLTLAERGQLEEEFGKLRSSLLDTERAVDTTKNELSLKRNRLRALEDMHRRLEGVGAGVRALLAKHDPEVYGMVADRIEAPQELTAAFAGLLGERLQYVIVKDQRHGLALLEELRRTERGRAHIVPARPPFVAGSQAAQYPDEPGLVCQLADRLVYAPEDEPLVRTVVGNAVVVESPEAAIAFVARHPTVTAVA
ncbi:MAG TPA: AAA family ATPase, partial [Polyangiaceae bacterium]